MGQRRDVAPGCPIPVGGVHIDAAGEVGPGREGGARMEDAFSQGWDGAGLAWHGLLCGLLPDAEMGMTEQHIPVNSPGYYDALCYACRGDEISKEALRGCRAACRGGD